jgi:hypothetical protein
MSNKGNIIMPFWRSAGYYFEKPNDKSIIIANNSPYDASALTDLEERPSFKSKRNILLVLGHDCFSL